MELKILRFYRWIANFSTSMVSAFVPLIVYKYTGKLWLSLLTLILQRVVNYFSNLIFRKAMVKKPQLFLILRLFPILLYEVLVIFIDFSPILCVIGISIGMALSHSFKYIPIEVIYSQNSIDKDADQVGFTVFVDRSAYIIAFICGGLFLDYISTVYLVVISIVLYILGTVPMLMIYVENRKKKNFNEEYAAYAHLILKKKKKTKSQSVQLKKKLRFRYAFYNFLITTIDGYYYYIPLFVYIATGSFTLASIINVIFDITYAFGSVFVGWLDKKKDLTGFTVVACLLCTACLVLTPITISHWTIYLVAGVLGFAYSFPAVFMFNRMLTKTRLVGRSNQSVADKFDMMLVNNSVLYATGFLVPQLNWFFYFGSILLMFASMYIPKLEEESRALLVDYFQENDIPS